MTINAVLENSRDQPILPIPYTEEYGDTSHREIFGVTAYKVYE